MKRLFFLLMLLPFIASAQSAIDTLRIEDNTATMEQMQTYILTKDSIVILARSDYGRARYDYLHRATTKKEKKKIVKLMQTFPFDSLQEVYFNDYSNFPLIDADHFPRVIDVFAYRNAVMKHSRATNAWVRYIADLLNEVNPMLPAETRIQYDKSKFNAFY